MNALDERKADVEFGAFMDGWRFDDSDPAAVVQAHDDWLNCCGHETLIPSVEESSPTISNGNGIRRTKPGTKRKAKSTCERRRQEIALLRLEASELEATIEQLSGQLKKGFTTDPQTQTTTIEWQAHAQGRLKKMQQVTKENERLRLLVRVQKKHAKDLRRILKKRIARATTVEYSLLRPARCMELGESPDDYNVYAKLLASTDVMKMEINGVVRILQTRIPDQGNGSFRESQVAKIGSQKVVGVQMITSEELPFSQERTCKALERCFGGDNNMNWEYMVENFGVLPGLAMDKLHVRWGTAIGSKMLCIWRVRRTFALDSGASVILLVSYINPVDATFGEPISYGFLLEERQWKIVRQRQPCENHAGVSTLVQTYLTMAPDAINPEYTMFWKESLVSTVIPSWATASASEHQRLENLLVDGAKQ